jgi:hypothetical protein
MTARTMAVFAEMKPRCVERAAVWFVFINDERVPRSALLGVFLVFMTESFHRSARCGIGYIAVRE